MDQDNKPRVSVGLPVFNGENYLEEALASILAQTFSDFELIISDNASTDRTEDVCKTYAAQDSRIRYYRSEVNFGAAWNFNRVFELSIGEYFKWAAHDDIIAPDFLAKCVSVLDQDPSVVLCYPRARIINEQGQPQENYDLNLNLSSPKSHERFLHLLIGRRCFEIFGVIRASILKQTPLIGNYGHSDGVLLARLGLLGRFCEVSEYLFFPRKHSQQSMNVYEIRNGNRPFDYHQYTAWFDPAKTGKLMFPYWRMLGEFCSAVWQTPLSWQERMRCYLHIVMWMRWVKYRLRDDLVIGARQTLMRFYKDSNESKDNRQGVLDL